MTLVPPTALAQQDLQVQFKTIADEVSVLARAFGVSITPYWDQELIHFRKLSDKKQLDAVKVVTHQRDFLIAAETENLHPNDPRLIWRTLSKMGMTPLSDIFDKISVEDTVEVYHWDSTTSFKNLKFFEFISLSLEEIYCLTWMEQLRFSTKMFLFFLEMNAKLKLAHYETTFAPRFDKYYLKEKLGQKRLFHIHLKWVSPVTQDGRKTAIICVNRSSFA